MSGLFGSDTNGRIPLHADKTSPLRTVRILTFTAIWLQGDTRMKLKKKELEEIRKQLRSLLTKETHKNPQRVCRTSRIEKKKI